MSHTYAAARLIYLLVLACLSQISFAVALPIPPVMEGVKAVTVAQSMRVNGIPTNARIFSTEKPIGEVRAFYQKLFGAKRFETTVQGWAVITQQDGDLMYMARLRQTPQGTEGTVSVADLKQGLANAGRPLGLGLPSGSKLLSDVDMDDPGKRSRIVALSNNSSIDANADYFISELKAQGYRVERDLPASSTEAKGRSIWLSTPKREALIIVAPLVSGTSVVINMTEITKTER